jgi:glycosyltransferase involved in cell wall biosynthesis
MTRKLVSVVIPTYNMEKYIKDAINSVLAQTYKNFELIVVDDGSTDSTCTLVREFGNDVMYIYQRNLGPSAARNNGIRASKGEYVAFLDADDQWEADKIDFQMKAMLASPRVGLVSCGERGVDLSGKVLRTTLRKNYKNAEALFMDLLKGNFVSGGSCALVRKCCFEKLGFFDEKITVGEDWDMWLRIVQNYDINFVEKILVTVKIHSEGLCSATKAEKIINDEIYVLNKIFKEKKLKNIDKLKNELYSCRYYSAAVNSGDINDIAKMRKHIFNALCAYPLNIFRKEYVSVLIKSILFIKRNQKQGIL